MKIVSIEIQNFKALKGKRTFSPPEGIIGIVGPNGSGKSTIANAISWCFYGPEVLPTGKADVISWGEKECSVEITFDIDGTRYQTRRWQGKGALGGARIDSEGRQVAEGLQATLRAVEALLGADRVAWLASVFARQDELSALSSLTPANRMKTVLRLLGVEELTGAIEHTRGLSREQSRSLINLKSSIGDRDQLDKQLSESKDHEKTTRKEIRNLERNLEKTTQASESLRENLSTLAVKIQQYNQYKFDKGQGDLAVQQSLESLRGILEFADKIQILPSRGQLFEPDYQELSIIRSDVNFYERRITEVEKELSNTSTFCPTCKRAYDNEDQLKEHKRELSRELDELKSRLGFDSTALEEVESEVAAYQEWEEYIKVRNEQIAEYERVRDTIFKVYDEYRRLQSETNQIIGPEDVNQEIESIQAESQRIDIEKNQITVDLAVQKERLVSIERDIERLEEEQESQTKVLDTITELEHSIKVADTTSKELIALKEKVVASAIPSIESRASSILNEMTGGNFTELALSQDYDIRYRNNLGEQKEYANLSGGERDVFALALRLALSELRADRIGILFLDEVLESLDDERQELVWGTLERLTRRYNQVFVVTHVEKFRDRMPYLL